MAFESSAQRNTNTNTRDQASNDSWKAAGFINVILTLPGQNPVSLPSLALKEDKYGELVTWLKEDPSRVEKLLPYIKLDFKAAQPVGKKFDFTALK